MTDAPCGRSESPLSGAPYSAVELSEDASAVLMLDQRRLPARETYHRLRSVAEVADGIRQMVVRGAPAIGIAGAYGMTLAAKAAEDAAADSYLVALRRAAGLLNATRPTAYNLGWAVARCLLLCEEHAALPGQRRWQQLGELGRTIHREDVEACQAMGRVGAERLADETTVLTYCNTGALATGGWGTALGVVRSAIAAGKRIKVIAPETRPYLQGARLTAWELQRDGIDVTVITDSAIAHCLQRGLVGAVVVGADRIAHNGDVANKIGTYGVATLARAHDIPFYVAAPWSTIDLATPDGQAIVIEERDPLEIAHLGERQLVPDGVSIYNPAFDVTPAHLIREIFTERGAFEPRALAAGS